MKTNQASKAKCPVCDYDLDANAIAVQAGGRTTRVCCDDCKRKLEAKPEKYLAAK